VQMGMLEGFIMINEMNSIGQRMMQVMKNNPIEKGLGLT
jgi:hypothetical protein